LLLTGSLVAAAGIVSGAETQTPEAVGRVAFMTFLSGPLLMAIAYLVLRDYPVTRQYLREVEAGRTP
jgi:glycoside/pentoside/hexuronide:cation symporter, GPH family